MTTILIAVTADITHASDVLDLAVLKGCDARRMKGNNKNLGT